MQLAQRLQAEINKSYFDRQTKSYQQGIEQIKRNLRGLTAQESATAGRKRIQRSNAAFLAEMRKAAKGLPSAITTRTGFQSALEINVFFAATRDLWEYVPGGNRAPLETVAGIYGFESLQDAYEYVMGEQREALGRIDALANGQPTDDIAEPTELTFDQRYQYVMSYISIMR